MGHLFGMVTPGDVGRKPLSHDLQTLIVLMDCLAQEAHGTRIPVSLSDVQVRKRVALSESTCPLSQTRSAPYFSLENRDTCSLSNAVENKSYSKGGMNGHAWENSLERKGRG